MSLGKRAARTLIVVAAVIAALCAAVLLAPAEALPPDACGPPDALRVAGATAAARKDYIALLRQDPSLQCAKSGLSLLGSPAPSTAGDEAQRLCERGDSLRSAHRDADAVAAYKSALEKDPTAPCAIDGLEAAGPSTLSRWVDAAIAALPQIAFVAGVALALFYLFLLTGYSDRMYGWLVQRPLIGRILGPRLNLAALDDQSDKKVGPTLDAHIKENLVRAREDVDRANAPEYELDSGRPRDDFIVLVGGDTGLKSALDKASEATEKTKLIAAIVNVIYAVLPIRRVDVAGVVDLPGGDAASATLNLSRNGTLAASASVNAPAVPAGTELGVPDFLKLADPAAVWVQYEVLRALKGGGDPLPAHGAESYVYVRQGLERQFAGDQRRADELYETAVKLAPDNWAARLNQAMTEARQAGNLPAAVAMLARAFDGIKQA